jgi:copper(I)-binding protein
MKLITSLAAAAMIAVASSVSFAAEVVKGDITIVETWTRATPPNARAGGGFAKITNSGSEADRIVAASSPVSKKTELHEMAVVDGVMKMREMEDGIAVPAGGTVELKPGGLHIMFMGLNEPLKEGETVPVKLTFEKAGEVDIILSVHKMGAKGMGHGHMKHGKMPKKDN